jgi:hypothetical protein
MKIKFLSSYRSQKGNTTFRYEVSGTPEQIEEYKAVQGEFFREDTTTGKPLWFTTRFCGNSGTLILAGKEGAKRYVPDMSAFEKADSLAKQFGGSLGNELAKHAAAELLGTKPAPVPADNVPAEPPF